MNKDYYKILGVSEFESGENIKTAYRNLARKWHPDIAGNTEEVLLKFKEINEAYEILSNSVKKEEYDRVRRFYAYAAGSKESSRREQKSCTEPKNINKYSNENKKDNKFSWEELLFKKQREKYGQKEKNIPQRGADIYTEVDISISESISGCDKIINVLQTGACPKCGGKKFVNGGKCLHCNGTGEFKEHRKFTVKIPAGIKDKSKIRLAKEGACGKNGGINGDLYITINIKSEGNYKIENLDILKTVPITPYEAVLGGEINISSITGKYTFKIAPNTQNGQKIRLSGCGLVQNEKIGDMIVTVEIRIPDKISSEELRLYKKLSEISGGSVRENL